MGNVLKALCVAVVLGVLAGCSGGSGITTPTDGVNVNPGSGMLDRMLQAWGTGNDDQAVEDDSDADLAVDITDVVWANSYGSDKGKIKKDGGTSSTDKILTVATWHERIDDDEGDIWFTVLYRDGVSGTDYIGTDVQVDDVNDLQRRPTVTAHIFNHDPEGDDENRLIVDIAYQRNNGTYWEIWHSRYMDNSDIESSSFSSFSNLYSVEISADDSYNYTRPDIVFDAAYDTSDEDRIHAVWQKDTGNDPEYSAIIYRRAIMDAYTEYDENVWEGSEYQLDDNNKLDEEPRIDVGQDDSGHVTVNGAQPVSIYYVGVVWHTGTYADSKWHFDTQFCMLDPTTGDPTEYIETLTSATGDNYNGYPYIDIDPVENSTRTTLIVFTYAHWRVDVGWTTVALNGTTTYRLKASGTPLTLFTSVTTRNGFPEAALQVDHYEGPFLIENRAYLTWLNDTWTIEDPTTPVEIYAGEVEYVTSGTAGIFESSNSNISYGTSDWDAWNNTFNYGPAIAIFDEEIGKAIWTAKTGISGTAPSVLGDHSDNS